MTNRFQPAVQEDEVLLDKIIRLGFPELQIARFLVYMDNKKRKTKGKYILGRVKKNNEEMKIASMEDNGAEYHYTIYLDKYVWDHLEEPDQIRTIRRLLCQCEIDHDNTNDVYKMKGYEVEDFYSRHKDELPTLV